MASRVLQRWLASRKGAVNRVLILSRYLGHGHVDDTYWYLTALPQLLADAAKRIVVSEHEDALRRSDFGDEEAGIGKNPTAPCGKLQVPAKRRRPLLPRQPVVMESS
jgi:hypothetical protein